MNVGKLYKLISRTSFITNLLPEYIYPIEKKLETFYIDKKQTVIYFINIQADTVETMEEYKLLQHYTQVSDGW